MTPLPTPGTVHVWRFDLDAEAPPDFLAADEHARADRFHFERDARRWRAGRSLLRQMLGDYLRTDPAALELQAGPFGKPCLPNSRLRFSVSHSDAVLLLAFAWDQEVGIDVERLRDDFVPEKLAAQVFSPCEHAALSAVPPGKRHAAFLSQWTAKEAYVKALGLGLSFPLTQLTLVPIAETDCYAAEDTAQAGAPADISVYRLPLLPGYAASLAALGPLNAIQTFNNFHASTDQHCRPGI